VHPFPKNYQSKITLDEQGNVISADSEALAPANVDGDPPVRRTRHIARFYVGIMVRTKKPGSRINGVVLRFFVSLCQLLKRVRTAYSSRGSPGDTHGRYERRLDRIPDKNLANDNQDSWNGSGSQSD
jgi:hypothetical protein